MPVTTAVSEVVDYPPKRRISPKSVSLVHQRVHKLAMILSRVHDGITVNKKRLRQAIKPINDGYLLVLRLVALKSNYRLLSRVSGEYPSAVLWWNTQRAVTFGKIR